MLVVTLPVPISALVLGALSATEYSSVPSTKLSLSVTTEIAAVVAPPAVKVSVCVTGL